jgi:hypothetical protein
MDRHQPLVVCTGSDTTCPVPHNRWIAESIKQGRFIPVRGLTFPVSEMVAEILKGN